MNGPTAGIDNGPASGVNISGTTLATSACGTGEVRDLGLCDRRRSYESPGSDGIGELHCYFDATSELDGNLRDCDSATIGGAPANVSCVLEQRRAWIGGIYQFNIQVPMGVSGDALPLVITVNGIAERAGRHRRRSIRTVRRSQSGHDGAAIRVVQI